jgi:hypothetical protein
MSAHFLLFLSVGRFRKKFQEFLNSISSFSSLIFFPTASGQQKQQTFLPLSRMSTTNKYEGGGSSQKRSPESTAGEHEKLKV